MFGTLFHSRPAAAVALLLAAAGAHAQTPAWTAIGSTGIVDDAGYNPPKFTFTNGGAFVKGSSAGSRSVVLRYNVGALPFTVNGVFQPLIAVRFKDNSTASAGGGNVRIVLKSDDINTGLGNLNLSTLDSDDFSASDSTQLQFMSTCGIHWDFANKSYYFEVTLTQDNAKDPNAQVYLQQIRMTDTAICTP